MYSLEEKLKVVQLYIKLGRSASATIRMLGYPDRKSVRAWYRSYALNGDVAFHAKPQSKYTEEQ
jgi:transposase-like protein